MKDVIEALQSSKPASKSLVELSGMAGALMGDLDEEVRAGIVGILSSKTSHDDNVQAVADALVNHLVPLWQEVRVALESRLDAEDKYTFMSVLIPLLFDAEDIETGLRRLQTIIPPARQDLAARLVTKIQQGGEKCF